MQILIKNISKYLLFAVLSCSFIIAMNSSIPDISSLSDDDNSASIENISDTAAPAISNKTQATNPAPVIAKKDSIWYHMSQEFKLDDNTQSAAVRREIHRLTSDPSELYRILNAAAPDR